MTSGMSCHICGGDLFSVDRFNQFYRVTSDTKPWARGGQLSICSNCGITQKPITPAWQEEAAAVYDQYSLYHQSTGVDQQIFDATGAGRSKNTAIVERLLSSDPSSRKQHGRLLDLGCGRGAFLRAFSAAKPEWSLIGSDTNATVASDVEAIPNAHFQAGGLEDLVTPFDIVSLCHVLEHVPDPIRFLSSVKELLGHEGTLLIQVPNLEDNPFDLFVVDHCSHFQPRDLIDLLPCAGFRAELVATDWIDKEITVLAKPDQTKTSLEDKSLAPPRLAALRNRLDRVQEMASQAKAVVDKGHAGIFGTAVAAVWLDQETECGSAFFVDEDPGRIGKIFLGREIIHPKKIPAGADILVPFRRSVAKRIISRIGHTGIACHVLTPD